VAGPAGHQPADHAGHSQRGQHRHYRCSHRRRSSSSLRSASSPTQVMLG
jgi:hypothetical protein